MSLIFIIEKHKITSSLVLWRYNQMTVEQVCAPKKPQKPLVAMTTSRREDAKTAVCGGKLAGW